MANKYANRDASTRAILSSNLDMPSKLLLTSGNHLLRTDQEDLDKAAEAIGQVGRAAGRGLKSLWGKFKVSAQEWADEREAARAREQEQARKLERLQLEEKEREEAVRVWKEKEEARKIRLLDAIKRESRERKEVNFERKQRLLRRRLIVLRRARADFSSWGYKLRQLKKFGKHKQNLAEIAQGAHDAKVLMSVDDATSAVDGLLAMDLSVQLLNDMSSLDPFSSDLTDYDDQMADLDERVAALNEQNQTIESTYAEHKKLFDSIDGADALEPQFGYDGRFDSNLVTDDKKETYSDADGTYHPKDDPDVKLDPLDLHQKDDPPPPPPPPTTTPATDQPKS